MACAKEEPLVRCVTQYASQKNGRSTIKALKPASPCYPAQSAFSSLGGSLQQCLYVKQPVRQHLILLVS